MGYVIALVLLITIIQLFAGGSKGSKKRTLTSTDTDSEAVRWNDWGSWDAGGSEGGSSGGDGGGGGGE